VHTSIQIMEGNPTASLNAKTAGLAHVEDQPHTIKCKLGFSIHWPNEFEQRDKWSFCLSAARMAVEQERQ
jgi:hypothetical protein